MPELLGTATFVALVMMLTIMEILGYFMVEHGITPNFTPLLVYENGLERSLSKFDRMRKRPSFLARSSIEKVRFQEFEVQDFKRTIRQCNVTIHMRDGWKVGLGIRTLEGSQRLAGLSRGELGLQVDWEEPKRRSKVAAKKDWDAPPPSQTRFCNQCGSRLDGDETYCVSCGRKVE